VVDAPEHLPPLPAAVEVAAYRIALEALTNVARHAAAHTCVISLAVGNGLHLDIRDDGRGLPPERHAGVGCIRCASARPSWAGSARSARRPAGAHAWLCGCLWQIENEE
jgi:glucose-6-phosphate-specific signal transduction histidine kinase